MKHIVILGGGTGGTMMANRLSQRLPDGWSISVVDRDDTHVYQPGLIFIPFGMDGPEAQKRARSGLLPPEVDLLLAPIERVHPDEQVIAFRNGRRLHYDVLIIATGSEIRPQLTDGLTGPGWMDTAFDFYTLEGATALRDALARFEGGRVVVNVAAMPIKCPVAPLEITFLADAFFRQKGIRDKVELVYSTPLDGAFTKPRASRVLGDLFGQRDIKVETDFLLADVNGEQGIIRDYAGVESNYDLLINIPIHQGSEVIRRSELGDDDAWVATHKHTLQSPHFENIFVIGDAADLPTSKAGSVAHFQSEVLTENVLRYVAGNPPEPDFDGHANCFVETGHGKAMLIDFNYDTEPLPGRFPVPGLGPFSLLAESRVNHWGKLGFRWAYWNLLLKGRELPIDHRLVMAGKWS